MSEEDKQFKPRTYNPLDYDSISESMADALMAASVVPLQDVTKFYGNGVYALFYTGDYPAYKHLAEQNRREPGSLPIYIGKSAPSNRKGDIDTKLVDTPDAGTALFDRSQTHKKSIQAATNLEVSDFQIRLLVCSYMWVPMVETALIARFTPVWNSLLDGFGNHDPGGNRVGGKMSKWDTLHPGRDWVARRKLTPTISTSELQKIVSSELRTVWIRDFK